jgi:predicted MFS family arabinose efflux permease
VLSALASLGVALCDSLLPALAFRAVAGIAMAGMYMPGLQALTHGVEGTIRARIAAWYTSSFTIGASLSFLFGRVGTLLGWRSAFVVAGLLGVAGVLIAWVALPRGAFGRNPDPQPLLSFRPVLANRDVLVLIVGYAAAIWGCVGLRQWIVVFLTFCAGDQADVPEQAWIILVVGALISFLGVPAGLLGNELSIHYGLRAIATLVFLLSALAGGLFGFTAMLPYITVLGLSVIAGFIVQGNFSNLTSGVLAVAAPRHRGATIGLYSCIGFGAGFLGTLLFGVTLDQFGGTTHLAAWILSFGTCGLALHDRGRRISFPTSRCLATGTLKSRVPGHYPWEQQLDDHAVTPAVIQLSVPPVNPYFLETEPLQKCAARNVFRKHTAGELVHPSRGRCLY